MPRSEKIRIQTSPEDGILFSSGAQNSLFRRAQAGVFTDFVREKQVSTKNSISAGREVIFDIEKNGTFVEDLVLKWKIGALEIPGDGTYIRLQNFSYSQIEEIEYKYSSNHIVTYRPDSTWAEYKFKDMEKQLCHESIHSGEMTPAERNTRATAEQTFRYKLPSPWGQCKTHLPLISALANKLRVTIKFRTPGFIIQTDGTKPSSLTIIEPSIEYQYLHLTAKEREEFTGQTLATKGTSFLFDEFQYFTKEALAGQINSGGFTIELNDFTGPISKLCILVRRSSDLLQATANTNYYDMDTTLFDGWDYEMESNGLKLFERTSVEQEIANYVEKFYSSPPSIEQIILFWDELPEFKNVASGHLTFSNLSNPKLRLFSDVANTEDITLTMIACRHNWYNHQAGNIMKIWN